MPPREYSSTRDPFVKLSLVKDTRRSLRKKTHLLLTEFTTKTVRHSLHPSFNETFTTEFKMSEFKVSKKQLHYALDNHVMKIGVLMNNMIMMFIFNLLEHASNCQHL